MWGSSTIEYGSPFFSFWFMEEITNNNTIDEINNNTTFYLNVKALEKGIP